MERKTHVKNPALVLMPTREDSHARELAQIIPATCVRGYSHERGRAGGQI
jgi:hypothetical protein